MAFEVDDTPLQVTSSGHGHVVKAGVEFQVSDNALHIFDWLEDGYRRYEAEQFVGPVLTDGKGNCYD